VSAVADFVERRSIRAAMPRAACAVDAFTDLAAQTLGKVIARPRAIYGPANCETIC
jgi:hypothetical protein